MEVENVKAVRERLIEAIEQMSSSPTAFARTYGLDPSYLAKKLKGIKPITRHDFRKLSESPINAEWVLTGEGNMFKSGVITPTPVKANKRYSEEKRNGLPVYDVDFALGYTDFINDTGVRPLAYVDFPGTMNATCWVRTTGDSMEPVIHSGDFLCLKKIEEWSAYLTMGEIYAVETINDMRTVKKIERGYDELSLTLVPVNAEYKRQEIRKDLIRQVFKVVAVAKLL